MFSSVQHALMLAAAMLGVNPACSKSQQMASGLSSGVQNTKPVKPEQDVGLRVTLAPRNPDDLDAAIANGEVMTPEQYKAKHAPTGEMLDQVRIYLEEFGLDVEHIGGHVMMVWATAEQAGAAFNTRILQFTNAAGKTMHTKTALPSWPSHLPPVVVSGLSTRPDKVSHAHVDGKRHASLDRALAKRAQGALTAKVIRSAYNVPSTARGAGQTVAMVELDGYDPKDLDIYAQTMGIRRVPTRNILLGGSDGTIQDQGARGEVTLDIQLAMAMAPDLAAIVVYEAPNGDHALNDIFNRLANPQPGEALIRAISCSWGEPESYMTLAQARAENIILKQLAAQGQTVFVAAGDSGARDDGSHLGTDDPASQPYALAVGGTNLEVANEMWAAERTWHDGGGGISQFWPAPSWQKGIEGRQTYASLTRRDVPDVALNADPNSGYAVYVGGWQVVGGTSCAAPLWAAFMAVANEQRATVNKLPLPYFATSIYAVGKSAQGKLALHDVADRSTNGYYPAVQGLDAATGWGSINGAPLLDALVQQ